MQISLQSFKTESSQFFAKKFHFYLVFFLQRKKFNKDFAKNFPGTCSETCCNLANK